MFTRKGRIFQSDDYKTLWIDRSGKGFIDTQYTPVGSTLDVASDSFPRLANWPEMRPDDPTIRFRPSNFDDYPVLVTTKAPMMFPTELLAPIMTVPLPPIRTRSGPCPFPRARPQLWCPNEQNLHRSPRLPDRRRIP